MKKIIIQKFGGTSLQTEENRMFSARMVWKVKKKGDFPIVVVSAIGRKGDPYATDTLLSFGREIHENINPREQDLLLSCGEIISTIAFVQNLEKMGLPARAFTGFQAGIITDENFSNSNVLTIIPDSIKNYVDEDVIPVIAGFQGMSLKGEITTFGRGGSDSTATMLGVALKAKSIEIYSDVEGVHSADPSMVKSAKVIPEMNFDEMFEMANSGAKIIHPKAAFIAKEHNIPLKLRHFSSDKSGTTVNDYKTSIPVSVITSKSDIIFTEIKKYNESDLLIFSLLAKQKISVDFIDISRNEITYVIQSECKDAAEQILKKGRFVYKMYDNFVKVSVIGAGMTGLPGVMSKIIHALQDENIEIYKTTDSHTTISCLILKKAEEKALNALHQEFISKGDL